jgi:hypothetical protein
VAESNLSEDRNCIAHSSRSKEGRRISRMHSRQAAPNLATANICNLSGIPVCVPPLIVDRFSASSEARLIGLLRGRRLCLTSGSPLARRRSSVLRLPRELAFTPNCLTYLSKLWHGRSSIRSGDTAGAAPDGA